jgi:signal transduction histidine kinase
MQVILNILKNSQDNFREKVVKNEVDNSAEMPKITITTKKRTILICDNGGGIEKHILPKIFDPYFSTKDEKNGTGLGLYMSKTIIEGHHNGHLYVYNQEDDYGKIIGVCFEIELGELD